MACTASSLEISTKWSREETMECRIEPLASWSWPILLYPTSVQNWLRSVLNMLLWCVIQQWELFRIVPWEIAVWVNSCVPSTKCYFKSNISSYVFCFLIYRYVCYRLYCRNPSTVWPLSSTLVRRSYSPKLSVELIKVNKGLVLLL